ncbi:uncharacterized protein LOC111639446 [Centruroides sculpturatus]|uniref:uncharacterized protein LOC111639446 n=1 Tax=Centruroides sculpturatus TaxID=218467 RepID=UPI000C6E24E5|nr:uncharacterized protein LOC111639446 [Centruroides sculpturatus]
MCREQIIFKQVAGKQLSLKSQLFVTKIYTLIDFVMRVNCKATYKLFIEIENAPKMQYKKLLNFFLLLTIFLCYGKCNNTNPYDVDDFQQTSMMLENAEMRIKTALKSVLKPSLPYLMRIFEEVNVSSPCTKSSVLFLKNLMKLKEWPLRMIDSFGKLPAGMLGVTLWISGDYDQCLDIEIPQNKKEITDEGKKQVRGKYCALTIGMPESLKRIAKSIHKLENNSLIKLAKEIIVSIKV